MNISKLAYKDLTDKPWSTILSVVLLMMGVGLVSLILLVKQQIERQVNNNLEGIDMVVGAKGSPLQLILSAIYHMDVPTGNISLEEANKLKKNRLIAYSIPVAYGDSYKGVHIVGTTPAYPDIYGADLAFGTLWKANFEVVVGADLASDYNLQVGDEFVGSHGLTEGGEHHAEHPYKIVGIFSKTETVLDRLVLTSIESVWAVHEHEEETAEHNPHHEEREITALFVKFRNPMGMIQLPRSVNKNTNMQAALPQYELSKLLDFVGEGVVYIKALAFIIIVASGVSVFFSLYKSLQDKKLELALMRTYGARRWQLSGFMLQKGLFVTLVGAVSGVCLSRLILACLSFNYQEGYGALLGGFEWVRGETWLLIGGLGVGTVASLLPAVQVFNINISKTLSNG